MHAVKAIGEAMYIYAMHYTKRDLRYISDISA